MAAALQANAKAKGTAGTPLKKIGPLTTRSEFELFVEDAAGAPLPVYGRQLFNQTPTTFAPMDRIPVPAAYVIGPGDELLIRVWGKIDMNASVTVDRNGQIFLPNVGTLSVAGLRYEQLENYLRSALSNFYKGFELNVTMGQLRSIQVFVLGSARQPGAYTVSSLSTLVNALLASGGPSATGSMRRIQLRRAERVVTEFDIYDLLRTGDKSHDVQLLPGDVIYIPSIGPQVALMGSVNDPGIYELKGETTIAAALKDAGRLTNLAAADRVLLERIEDHRRRRVDDFPLDENGLQRVLSDGDMLRIFPISPKFDNAVTLRGNVAQPGRFPWREGMRVSDLIPSRDFLVTRDYWNQQNHSVENATVDMMTDLSQNSAEINWEYAAIERLDEEDLSTRVIPFNLGNAIANPASPDNQVLKVGDVITIFSRRDLPLPLGKHATFVRIGGEVNAPGVYRVEPDETLQNVVARAGGLTPHSYLYAAQLNRVSTRQAEVDQLRVSIAQMQRELISRYVSASPLSTASSTDQQTQFTMQQTAIAQLSAVQPTGRIILGIKPTASTVADIPKIPLEDGDTFYVPPRLSTIQVTGSVYNENAFRYQPGKHLSAYLADAGGPNRQADTKRIFLVRADGTVVSRQNHGMFWREDFENATLLPGDAIIVPTKMRSPNGFMEQLPFISQILSEGALTAAVIATNH
jgi:protein involved in polysaccharide export with SLBB domain